MGKLKHYSLILSFLLVIISSCTINDSSGEEVCGDFAIESELNYNSTSSSFYTIKDVSASGNCLTITISASGCSGDRWQAELYFSEQTPESSPIQRFSKLSLITNEACLAVFEKSFTFNIGNMRSENDPFALKLDGWDNQIIIN